MVSVTYITNVRFIETTHLKGIGNFNIEFRYFKMNALDIVATQLIPKTEASFCGIGWRKILVVEILLKNLAHLKGIGNFYKEFRYS